jgi:hypothetical protein
MLEKFIMSMATPEEGFEFPEITTPKPWAEGGYFGDSPLWVTLHKAQVLTNITKTRCQLMSDPEFFLWSAKTSNIETKLS